MQGISQPQTASQYLVMPPYLEPWYRRATTTGTSFSLLCLELQYVSFLVCLRLVGWARQTRCGGGPILATGRRTRDDGGAPSTASFQGELRRAGAVGGERGGGVLGALRLWEREGGMEGEGMAGGVLCLFCGSTLLP